ncbi:hypothetical protein K2173_024868 [Erythroxylum novogranatense]|uniref:BZIP domain-containing protein n=1 Tax=Erythroxylum novogranatense TaxID=1862640 RepID=A0AAV8UCS8_9ROSI|nr:hypothetical protein K2173_024868 [Erythroxylum novogranatense]
MRDNMDDGEVELSDRVLLPNTDSSSNFQGSASVDSFLDDLLKNTRTCTHTHTCNPPGPDATHTHTCYHTHTQVIASEEEQGRQNKERSKSNSKRPSGNREAVRKYREKKKAQTAYLEEEVKKLRVLNQQLVRKLQGQAILEAEVSRLRSLLVDLRGKIDNELGVFPIQKQGASSTIFKDGDCGLLSQVVAPQCQVDLPCFNPQTGSSSQGSDGGNGKLFLSWEGNCQAAITDCEVNGTNLSNAEGHRRNTVE